jgi:sugar-specific transcriptional regulator TrmB
MLVSELHEKLMAFGFDKEEAEIFIFLTALGPTPARVIARRFDINRVKAYRILNELEQKGLIQKSMERPVRFIAQPIEEILRKRIQITRETLHNLEKNQTKIIEEIEQLKKPDARIEEDPRFRIYQGRQQIYELIANMCGRVKEEIRIVAPSTDILRLILWGIDYQLMELVQTGKKVKMLTEINESIMNEIQLAQNEFEIRHISVPSAVRFVAVDNDETLTSVAIEDSMSMTTPNDRGLWTNASGFIKAMQIFYDALWNKAPDSQVIINSLKTGKRPQEFVTIRSQEEYNKNFKALLENTETSIDIMVNKIQDLPLSLEDIAKTQQDMKIRILTYLDDRTSNEFLNIFQNQEIRHIPKKSRLNLVVSDGRESLLSTMGPETSIHSVWSNLIDYVETTSMIFDDYWNNSKPMNIRYREISAEKNKNELTEIIVSSLSSEGWNVNSPGKVTSANKAYKFDVYAKKKSRTIGINIIIEENGFNHVLELCSRKEDLRGIDLILCSIQRLEEEVIRLSTIYGINLIHGVEVNEMVNKILNS